MKKTILSITLMLAVAMNTMAEKQVITLKVNEMECGGCQAKVEKTLSQEKGVKDLQFNLEKKLVTITFDDTKTTVEKLQAALVKYNKYTTEVVPQKKDQKSCDKSCTKGDGKTGCCASKDAHSGCSEQKTEGCGHKH